MGCVSVYHVNTKVTFALLLHTMFAWMKFLVARPLLSSRRSSYQGFWLSSEAHRRSLLLTLTANALLELSRSPSERESPWSFPPDTGQRPIQEDLTSTSDLLSIHTCFHRYTHTHTHTHSQARSANVTGTPNSMLSDTIMSALGNSAQRTASDSLLARLS